MAAVTPVKSRHGNHTIAFSYSLTQADAIGHPIPDAWADYADRSVHILGTFDGATVVVEGSNNGASYLTLTDPQGNGISKTSAAIEQITEQALFTRPSASGGGAAMAITVVVVCRRGRGGMEV